MASTFRSLLFPHAHPRVADARGLSAREFASAVQKHPLAVGVLEYWRGLYAQPFHGLTCDGHCEPGLFALAEEGAPTRMMVAAAQALLARLDGTQRQKLLRPIDAAEWRAWSNPEFIIHDCGLRLEDQSIEIREAMLALIAASLSARGFAKARDCMRMNAFLGELCDLPLIMNEWSYHFQLFGEPSIDKPWGWNLLGHHLCLNCFVLGNQMVISPVFMGAEPNEIDAGPLSGLKLFVAQESEGLTLMRALAPQLRERSRIYARMKNDPAMPPGRWHPADGLHLGGAFQDNRIVPYEGVPVGEFSPQQRDRLLTIIAAFLEYLPPEPLAAQMRRIESHLDRTYWAWVGGYGDEDPFYYRVQSPVIMVEFDHHQGVWLTNQEPAKCHIHTVVRTPNGNDYGRDLLQQHYARVHPGRSPGAP
jgi:Protein of unknown function (DUF3500)